MKKYSFWAICVLLIAVTISGVSWVSIKKTQLEVFDNQTNDSVKTIATGSKYSNTQLFDNYISSIYDQAQLLTTGLDFGVFKKAIVGYYNLKSTNLISEKNLVLTIIDFSKKSTEKRLWILDLGTNKLLYNTFVAHGQGSGGNLPDSFSNLENSHKSSLGFYVTSETYFGKHGLSMKLEGMDKGFNTNARDRAVVVHGADYVSQDFINRTGRLGRSHGCPALPTELTKSIINTIKGQTTMFINGPANDYRSNYLDENLAVNNFVGSAGTINASI